MLDLKYIKANKEEVKKQLSKRMDKINLEYLLSIDARLRKIQEESDDLKSQRKTLSKEIGQLRKGGNDSSEIEEKVKTINANIDLSDKVYGILKEELNRELSFFPNIPDERLLPGGKENNKVVKVHGAKPEFNFEISNHVDLSKSLNLVDYERGVKLGGAGFWLYTGLGAAMEWALLNYFCQEHHKDGYTFMLPPHLLTNECGFAAGQFPKFYDDVFHVQAGEEERKRFLLPTSETAILNVFRDEIIDESVLPIKAFAYSPCYRSEKGSYRAEERGTVRGHQFNKVEMFQFTKPENAEEALMELVGRAERLMEDLGLHYQTSLLAAEDASASMSITYDVEVWIPSMGIYKEVSSISCAADYQSRRAKIRFRRKNSKRTELVHTLNASGLATSRLLPAIIEQNQQEDGSIKVPKPLQSWLNTDVIKPTGKKLFS